MYSSRGPRRCPGPWPQRRLRPGVAHASPRTAFARQLSPRRLVEERAAHRIIRDVPLADRHLEKVCARRARAEHLRARPQVGAPDPTVTLVEAPGIERVE